MVFLGIGLVLVVMLTSDITILYKAKGMVAPNACIL